MMKEENVRQLVETEVQGKFNSITASLRAALERISRLEERNKGLKTASVASADERGVTGGDTTLNQSSERMLDDPSGLPQAAEEEVRSDVKSTNADKYEPHGATVTKSDVYSTPQPLGGGVEMPTTDSTGAGKDSESLRKLAECQKRLSEKESEKTTLVDANESLRNRSERLEKEWRGKFVGIERERDQLQLEIKALEETNSAMKVELEQTQLEKGKLVSQITELRHQLELDERLESLMWPKFLESENFASWKQRLDDAIMEKVPVANAVMIVANLFIYNATRRLGSEWNRRLIDVLFDFSRAFFSWCRELDYDAERASREAQLWADAFNRDCEDSFSIEVPEPDTPFDKRTMVSYGDGYSGTSPDVKNVKTWCIRDSNGRMQKQAEVTTC